MPETRQTPAESDFLEDAFTEALAALEAGGTPALEQFLCEHADLAPRLREALRELDQIELLQSPGSRVPARLGEFHLREQLGAGGMGVVYLADQTSLGREVALKVVRPELLFLDGARERFRREIDAVARLEHPAIVPILATGIDDGIPYYVMPRIRGRSADAVVKAFAGRNPGTLMGEDLRLVLAESPDEPPVGDHDTFAGAWWQAVVRLVRKAALGIEHAHSRGILHRDLKPSNLMLTADGRAIVLDFGLAHARGDARLTRTGSAAGSPAYMAPEQLSGEPADERTDVYGLGATLHCLLGLRSPFDVAESESLRSLILAGTRQELGRHAVIPTELLLVVDTAMDVDRVHRYASAGAIAADLQAVLDGSPILARRLPVRVRMRRFVRRHRVLATVAAALAVFLVVLPTVLLWQQHLANEVLTAQVRRSDRSVKVSVDAVEKLLAAVARDRMRYVPAAQDVAAEMLRGAIGLFDDLAADAGQATRVRTLRVHALLRLAEVEMARGRMAEATASAQRANTLMGDGDLRLERRLLRASARRLLAGLILDLGRNNEAAAIAETSMADCAVLALAPEFRARAVTIMGNLHYFVAVLAQRRGDTAAQERALRAAVTCCAESTHRLDLASAQVNLCQFLKLHQHLDEALQLVAAAIATATASDLPQVGWPVPRQIEARARYEQAGILQSLGREAEAVDAGRLALASFDLFLRDYPSEPHARKARGATANNLAKIYLRRREWSVARQLLKAACQDQVTVLARDPTDAEAQRFLVAHRLSLSACLRELGDLTGLEAVARAVGKMDGAPVVPLNAARNLLRCAAAAAPARAAALRAEALDLLVEANRRNLRVDLEDPLYRPLRDEPRFKQIATRRAGR